MPRLLQLPVFSDERGSLAVWEKSIPFEIKRIFFIYGVKSQRGGHRHRATRIALIAASGPVIVNCQSPAGNSTFRLEGPSQCLLMDPEDWHTMDFEDKNCCLIALASREFDREDYIYESYR